MYLLLVLLVLLLLLYLLLLFIEIINKSLFLAQLRHCDSAPRFALDNARNIGVPLPARLWFRLRATSCSAEAFKVRREVLPCSRAQKNSRTMHRPADGLTTFVIVSNDAFARPSCPSSCLLREDSRRRAVLPLSSRAFGVGGGVCSRPANSGARPWPRL